MTRRSWYCENLGFQAEEPARAKALRWDVGRTVKEASMAGVE